VEGSSGPCSLLYAKGTLLAQCDVNIDDLIAPDSPVDISMEAEWLDGDGVEIQFKMFVLTR
jgi:hypothetical protein